MRQPLTGIRVLELALGQQGPYAAMLLGDMGAEVIKVELRWGDMACQVGVLVSGVSTLFTANNRNKRSLCLDLAQPTGRQILLRLLRHADVLVENFSPAAYTVWSSTTRPCASTTHVSSMLLGTARKARTGSGRQWTSLPKGWKAPWWPMPVPMARRGRQDFSWPIRQALWWRNSPLPSVCAMSSAGRSATARRRSRR